MDASGSHAPSAPLRQLNPAPQQGYRIRLTIQDAPGPLVLTDATAQYDVVNEVECGKDSPYGGVYRMTSSEVMRFKKLDDATYEGIVYLDQILDEDYYERGVCKWQLSGVSATLRATGGAGETQFAPSLSLASIAADGSETRYYWKGRYPRSDVDDFVSFGETDRGKIKGELQDRLFTISFSAAKEGTTP